MSQMHHAESDPSDIQSLLDRGCAEHAAPCAVLGVWRLGKTPSEPPCTRVWHSGTHTYAEHAAAVHPDDCFDIASLTKVVVTTTLAMRAVADGALSLDAPLDHYLPRRKALGGPVPTIRQILSHCAGFPDHILYEAAFPDARTIPARREAVLMTPLSSAPQAQTRYSDIGFMLLGFVLEELGNAPLDQLAQREVFQPLGMRTALFNPSRRTALRIVPTESKNADGLDIDSAVAAEDCWRGTVHDENARWLGGIAGHAGLFCTIDDLLALGRMYLRRGRDESGRVIIPEDVLLTFTRPTGLVAGSSRGLGWDTPAPPCSGGENISPLSFGHTGFTGTSLWIDPVAGRVTALLTNAIHPVRQAKAAHRFFAWRNELNTLATR